MLLGLGTKIPKFQPFQLRSNANNQKPLGQFLKLWCNTVFNESHAERFEEEYKGPQNTCRWIQNLRPAVNVSDKLQQCAFPLPSECIEDFITIVTSFPSFCADMKRYPLQHKRLLVSDMCPDWLSTLIRCDASFARSLTSRNRADWNHIMCDQQPYPVWFSAGAKSYPLYCDHSLNTRRNRYSLLNIPFSWRPRVFSAFLVWNVVNIVQGSVLRL